MTKTEESTPYIEADTWFENAPVFIAHDGYKNLIEDIKEHGFWYYENNEEHNIIPQIFYVLAMLKKTVKTPVGGTSTAVTTTITRAPRLMKVVTNLVGDSITVVDSDSVDLEDVEEVTFFKLPKIPYELINDIDDLFRKAFKDIGTEAIIIFTYDTSYLETDKASDGWGFVTPKQKNTAHSCDYDPQSIIDDLPDDKDVRLVGTAHSHPNMAAYCSGVDKADQAEFDGLHITYGWKAGARETEFYIELQIGGTAFTMQPEQVFLDAPKEIDNPKIEPWLKKIEKKAAQPVTPKMPPKAVGSGTNTGSSTAGTWYTATDEERYKNLPKGCPFPSKVTLVAAPLLTEAEFKLCPVCDNDLTLREKEGAKCLRCRSFLMWLDMGKGVESIIKHRAKQKLTTTELDMKSPHLKPPKDIWVWEEVVSEDNKIEHNVFCYYEKEDSKKKSNQGADYASKK